MSLKFNLLTLSVALLAAALVCPAQALPGRSRNDFVDLLNASVAADNYFVLSDMGAWHGILLAPAPVLAIAGPYVHGGPGLVADYMFRPQIYVDGQGAMDLVGRGQHLYPGKLAWIASGPGLGLSMESIFFSPRSSGIKIVINNTGTAPIAFKWNAIGSLNRASVAHVTHTADQVVALLGLDAAASPRISVSFAPSTMLISTGGRAFTATASQTQTLVPGASMAIFAAISFCFDAKEMAAEAMPITQFFTNPTASFTSNEQRWNGYVASVTGGPGATGQSDWLAMKAVATLITNWRSAAIGVFRHGGLFPSFISYQGFWAWDSWKHARALAKFDIGIAISQIQAMFDYQSGQPGAAYSGMIPDVVRATDVNWCNTKPALAAWAVMGVAEANRTAALPFLQDMLPRLLAYHQWWYTNRDHNHNGLVEFGSSQKSSLECMRWESGMDNAIRFDTSTMVTNSPGAFSATQDSVDANSFLYADKLAIAAIADAVGNQSLAATLRRDAAALQLIIQKVFYSNSTGFMHDLTFAGNLLTNSGCEAFAALWTGAPTMSQAATMAAVLGNPAKFNTLMPFPTFAADEHKFDPTGYWRGPVWVDQAFFALGGLRKFGFSAQADMMLQKLLKNTHGYAEGDSSPFNEYYNPLTGAQFGASHFGWTAAHTLLMILGDFAPV